MKRDVGLMREILRYVEAHDVGIEIENCTDAEVLHHLYLLEDAEFIKGVMAFQHTAPVCVCITWNGYEFLETSRSDAIWGAGQEDGRRTNGRRFGRGAQARADPTVKKTIVDVSPVVHQNGRG